MTSNVDPPAAVHHYTGAQGFAGIVSDQALRATNFSFLNDPSEVQYGRDLALDVLGLLAERVNSQYSILVYRIFKALAEKVISEAYVSCFTERYDDLSQWRAYGGGSVLERYCIGFDASVLASIFNTRPGGRFAKVLYHRTEQESRIQAVIERAVAFVEKNEIANENWPAVAEVVSDVIGWYLPEFKDNAYRHEAEWRIIRWHDGLAHDALSFETSRGLLRPFLPVPLPSPPPLTSLTVMAPSRRDAAKKAAEMLLRLAKVSSINVRHSSIPFAE
jgi:hypothetical protein